MSVAKKATGKRRARSPAKATPANLEAALLTRVVEIIEGARGHVARRLARSAPDTATR
jgi:hypothetical protein